MTVVTLGELLDAGVHFGHQSSRWNPKMFPYIYTEQNGIHVIDLVQTARLLTHAYNYLQKSSQQKKTFLFVGTKRQAAAIVAEEAQRCESHYINHRWLGGTLTNWSTVQKRVTYLKELDKKDKNWKKKKITARFVCALTVYDSNKKLISSIGKIEGSISPVMKGKNGFGYDPIFIPKGKKITFGEMKSSEKYKIDHRFKAFKKIKKLF